MRHTGNNVCFKPCSILHEPKIILQQNVNAAVGRWQLEYFKSWLIIILENCTRWSEQCTVAETSTKVLPMLFMLIRVRQIGDHLPVNPASSKMFSKFQPFIETQYHRKPIYSYIFHLLTRTFCWPLYLLIYLTLVSFPPL